MEILVNEPYEDGPGPEGKAQNTRKIYHVGSQLPGKLIKERQLYLEGLCVRRVIIVNVGLIIDNFAILLFVFPFELQPG